MKYARSDSLKEIMFFSRKNMETENQVLILRFLNLYRFAVLYRVPLKI